MTIGKITERKLINFLSKNHNYWVYNFPETILGQPIDIIAVNDKYVLFFEVKHCSNDRFSLSRIEPNQIATFNFLKSKGINNVFLALYFDIEPDIFYCVDYFKICNQKTISLKKIKEGEYFVVNNKQCLNFS